MGEVGNIVSIVGGQHVSNSHHRRRFLIDELRSTGGQHELFDFFQAFRTFGIVVSHLMFEKQSVSIESGISHGILLSELFIYFNFFLGPI